MYRAAAWKIVLFLVCLGPLAWLAANALLGELGANPIEAANRLLGDWALRFLLITLAISPLARLTRWSSLTDFRRMLGLFAFFYACLHIANYIAIDHFFDWKAVWLDLTKRSFITVGMAGFIFLLPLAATSTGAMMRRLGHRRWKRLHGLVYPAAILVVIHFFMMVRGIPFEPLAYAFVLAILLGLRIRLARR
ncbi:MAG: sulfoxide reductase heme-binding subunit YedZ [Rhodospirillales bacterium]|nr:sulfoxide reductase heme-binding subunit YedZ [Rhodospirillales bacterium]